MRRTKKIRIGVSMPVDGEDWFCVGNTSDEDMRELLEDFATGPYHIVWVTATVPLPPPEESRAGFPDPEVEFVVKIGADEPGALLGVI